MTYRLTAPCLFGIEAVLKKEIGNLGYPIVSVEDGRVVFEGDAAAICRSNIRLRTAERILLNVGEFQATTFDELFEAVKALPWEDYLPKDARFPVAKASSIKSKLFSTSDIQAIVKKAIVERLKAVYHIEWFKEDGANYPIRVFIKKDQVVVGIDTSGESLHKRGYRTASGKAPISETLAAALIQLSVWKKERPFIDPFCGSGTFAIEAAMIGANIAPGLNRSFTAQKYNNIIDSRLWMDAIDEACDMRIRGEEMIIQGYDIDGEVLKQARENARNAEVDDLIHFQERDVRKLSSPKKYGVIVTNPPYGERLLDKESIMSLYKDMGKVFRELDTWSYYVITSFEDFEKYFGLPATKKRKLYNGMLKTDYYQYLGKKPTRKLST
jgi:putative N6-adenine-specific DNA methylase